MKYLITILTLVFSLNAHAWWWGEDEPTIQYFEIAAETPAAEKISWNKGVDVTRPMHENEKWRLMNSINKGHKDLSGTTSRHLYIVVSAEHQGERYSILVTKLLKDFQGNMEEE